MLENKCAGILEALCQNNHGRKNTGKICSSVFRALLKENTIDKT